MSDLPDDDLPPVAAGPLTLLELVKLDLRIEAGDAAWDALLRVLLAEARIEALRFLDRAAFPVCESADAVDGLPPDLAGGIRVLVRGKFEGLDAAEMASLRQVAEGLLMPYRQRLGA